jgi:hypothetical protein
MNDQLIWPVLACLVLVLLLLDSTIRYIFPPRCQTCGRRYNHNAHAQCPYCVPLDRPGCTSYGLPFSISLFLVGIGMLLQDGTIIGAGLALFVAIVISTQARIPWDEISGRVLAIGVLCVIIITVASLAL